MDQVLFKYKEAEFSCVCSFMLFRNQAHLCLTHVNVTSFYSRPILTRSCVFPPSFLCMQTSLSSQLFAVRGQTLPRLIIYVDQSLEPSSKLSLHQHISWQKSTPINSSNKLIFYPRGKCMHGGVYVCCRQCDINTVMMWKWIRWCRLWFSLRCN